MMAYFVASIVPNAVDARFISNRYRPPITASLWLASDGLVTLAFAFV